MDNKPEKKANASPGGMPRIKPAATLSSAEVERLSDEDLLARYATQPDTPDKPFIMEMFRRLMTLRAEADWLKYVERGQGRRPKKSMQ